MGKKLLITFGILLLLVISAGAYVYFSFYKTSPLALLVIESGNVQYMTEGGEWKDAKNNMKLEQGDSVKTLENSLANIIFSDSVMRLDSSTEITIDTLNKESVSVMQVAGKTWSRILKISGISNYEVSTPDAIASVRGTGFAIIFDGNSTEVKVVDGVVNVGSSGESINVSANEQITVIKGDQILSIEDLTMDDWITLNNQLDEEHKQQLKQEIMKKYANLINIAKEQYGLTDADLDDMYERWIRGEISVKEAIANGDIPSSLANLIPEQFKRY